MQLAFNRSTVEEIDARTGLAFPRLQFAPHFVGPELPALRRVVADILPRQSNAVCRRELYTVLGRPVAQEFFETILCWHEREREARRRQAKSRPPAPRPRRPNEDGSGTAVASNRKSSMVGLKPESGRGVSTIRTAAKLPALCSRPKNVSAARTEKTVL